MSKVEDFIVEIGCEELPPKEQNSIASIFSKNLQDRLLTAGLNFANTKYFASPRRIAVIVQELDLQQPEQIISKRGPALNTAYNSDGTPTKSALGFAASCGVNIQDLQTKATDKGEWLYFEQKISGENTKSLLPEIVQKSLDQLPIKKPMRWGSGEYMFIRPVHWVLMLLGPQIVPAKIFGIQASNYTYGHRIHCPKPIQITAANTYEEQLSTTAMVIPNFTHRQELIRASVQQLAAQENGEALIEQELLDIVTGLVEYPVPLMGGFDPDFLRVPKECLSSAMQEHQKCFPILDHNGALLPKFILISNLLSTDPQTVIRGNNLVMHARLADAAFYFDKDQQTTLDTRVLQLQSVVYQKKLGSLYDKTLRLQKLATFIAEQIKADISTTARAAFLAKADLLTSMVYEFPELQGTMGWYYSVKTEGLDIANAIKDHYKPKFAQDNLPESGPALAIALADRLDALVGFFGIGMIPNGEKDPYGLRRQGLAIMRILIEKEINLDLNVLLTAALKNYADTIADVSAELMAFCFERAKAYLSETVPSKTFAAVMATRPSRPLDFYRRVMAVVEFQHLEISQALSAANKRVQNILEKNPANNAEINVALFESMDEKNLFSAIASKELEIKPWQTEANYSAILKSLASLQDLVDNFFNNVMVMVDNTEIRSNRLNLLQRLRNLFLQVADVSLL